MAPKVEGSSPFNHLEDPKLTFNVGFGFFYFLRRLRRVSVAPIWERRLFERKVERFFFAPALSRGDVGSSNGRSRRFFFAPALSRGDVGSSNGRSRRFFFAPALSRGDVGSSNGRKGRRAFSSGEKAGGVAASERRDVKKRAEKSTR